MTTCIDCLGPCWARKKRCWSCYNAKRIRDAVAAREPRFWSRVDKSGPNGCWLWQGRTGSDGYGLVTNGYRNQLRAHRAAYAYMVGPIPDGLTIDHLCRVRACVNPAHLEPVTAIENSRRAATFVAYQRTQCRLGHPLPRHIPGRHRSCVSCARERYHARRDALGAA